MRSLENIQSKVNNDKNTIADVFLRIKPVDLFVKIEDGILLSVSNEINLTYTHANRLIRLFEEKNLVIREKRDGRSNNIILTEKGKKMKELLKKVREGLK